MAHKNVGIWIRVSTEEQAKGESPEHHKERAYMYAKLKGWEVKEVYNLAGVSGKSVMDHPEAQRMIEDIKLGKISGLIFSKIARLARNTRQLLEFSEIFRNYNADLISIYENIDTSSPAGRLFYTIISAMAEWEREEIASRVKASIEIRAKLGKKLGGQAQFGFKWKGDELVLNTEEAPIRKKMYELFLEIGRNTSVATKLNEMGYRTRSGAKFSRGVIKRWLRDPISKGLRRANYSEQNSITKATQFKPREEWIFHECPRIVSDDLWQKVNDILDKQDSNRQPILNRKVHLFTNYIFCHCGNRMNVRSRLTHYKCTSNDCNHKIRREDLEEAFKSRLIEFLNNKRELKKYFKQSENQLKSKNIELEILKKKQNEIQSEIKSILDLHLKGQIPTEAFEEYHKKPYEQSQQLKEHIIKLENEITNDTIHKKSTDFIIKNSKNIYEKWSTYKRDKKREIIDAVIENIVIGENEINFNLKRILPKRQFSELGENGEQNDYLLFYHQ
ncbi:site-specific DNA recombinase [Lutibacter oceani]|uniref:Site-specific DNA recombinase n=1 Tax=Lutibacter oceani TaxID=1853311 RepID=A0A3D9RLD8_9FLAO|nr:recombinase family protein [Lutibacter oceani]REE80699.1 site-specific DNA recombinase [Lutibacter oceani]